MTDNPQCSFCGTPASEAMQLVAGTGVGIGKTVFICAGCIEFCARMVITKHPEWRDKLDLSPIEEA
jgi:ATP-dependent protease Clp ATPase subunit